MEQARFMALTEQSRYETQQRMRDWFYYEGHLSKIQIRIWRIIQNGYYKN